MSGRVITRKTATSSKRRILTKTIRKTPTTNRSRKMAKRNNQKEKEKEKEEEKERTGVFELCGSTRDVVKLVHDQTGKVYKTTFE